MGQTDNRFLTLLRSSRSRPLVIAHRGDSFFAPENTREAARKAFEAGADAWELDVQLTRDGVPIVFHDEWLLRTTDVAERFNSDARAATGYRVSDFDFDELRALDAGSWFVKTDGRPRSAPWFGTRDRIDPAAVEFYRSGRIVIPTLIEVLELTKELNWLVNVEIKSFPERPPSLVERVVESILEMRISEQVLISSFDHGDVALAKSLHKDIAAGILIATPLFRTAEYAADLVGADTVHASWDVMGGDTVAFRQERSANALRVELVAELQKRDIPLLVYTVNDHGPESLADHLGRLKVDGIFTDDPDSIKRFYDSGPGTSAGAPR